MKDLIERRIEAILATVNKSHGDGANLENLTPEQIVEKQEQQIIAALYYDDVEAAGLSISEYIPIEDKVLSVAGDGVMWHIISKCPFSVNMVRQLHTNLRKALEYRNLWESDREQCIAEIGKFNAEVFQHIKDMADPNSKARKLSDIFATPARPKMRLQDLKPDGEVQIEPTNPIQSLERLKSNKLTKRSKNDLRADILKGWLTINNPEGTPLEKTRMEVWQELSGIDEEAFQLRSPHTINDFFKSQNCCKFKPGRRNEG